jgi:hypothetical protein
VSSISTQDYANAIRFRWFGQNFPMRAYRLLDRASKFTDRSLEIANTRLPDDQLAMKLRLRHLCGIPRMSTCSIAAIINHAVRNMPSDQCFVNVGVWNGFTLLSGMADNPKATCIGIDNFSEFGGPREAFLERFDSQKSDSHYFHEMDYRSYFKTRHQGEIGFYIYDGEHSYRNQFEGLQIAEPHLAQGALILVDDTNWEQPRQATLDFIEQSDKHYEILFDEGTCFPGHPTYWNGVMLLRMTGP